MKKKKVYMSPDVKGIYVLQSINCQRGASLKDVEIKQELEKKEKEKEEKENGRKEIEFAKEEAYKKGRLDAEHDCESRIKSLKSEYASLVASFTDAVRHLTDTREKIWQENEAEIVSLILTVSKKIVGYEINTNGIEAVKHVVKEALSYVSEKKVVTLRLSPDDVRKIHTLEQMKVIDQNVKMVEDSTITSGGCIVETNFGTVDSQIETRWEEILKAFLGNKNEPAVH